MQFVGNGGSCSSFYTCCGNRDCLSLKHFAAPVCVQPHHVVLLMQLRLLLDFHFVFAQIQRHVEVC